MMHLLLERKLELHFLFKQVRDIDPLANRVDNPILHFFCGIADGEFGMGVIKNGHYGQVDELN